MDKNTGEQLNRAYEAYRQACMDKDKARKELQQKVSSHCSLVRDIPLCGDRGGIIPNLLPVFTSVSCFLQDRLLIGPINLRRPYT